MRILQPISLLSLAAVATCLAPPGFAQGPAPAAPQPFTAGRAGGAVGRMLPRETPRTIAMLERFDEITWVESLPLDVPALLAEDDQQDTGPRRMGIVEDLPADSLIDGQWIELDSGGWLWLMRIRAPGAVALRVRIEPWTPPLGAELLLFAPRDPANTARGPFTATDPHNPSRFWTPTIYSSELYIEYYLPSGVDRHAAESQLRITGILNQYLDPYSALQRELGCHLDAMCYPAWTDEAAGVGGLASIGVDLPGGFFCTGALLNRIPSDLARIFMTATHCGVTDANADTTEVTWFWQRASCGGTIPNPDLLPMTVGSTVLAQDVTTDWTLVALTSGIPGGLLWEGWDANAWGNGDSATGIHHPDGSWKRISFGSKTGNGGFRPNPEGGVLCISGDSYTVNYPEGDGLTEPGSSGSPIFDSSARVRGTLSCAFSNCSSSNNSYYGRLDQFFSLAEPYLVPADPVFANNVYGGFERGTDPMPFNTALEATHAVIAGHTIFFDGGNYLENLTIDRPMTLRSQSGTVRIGN